MRFIVMTTIFLMSCGASPSLDLENYKHQENVPEFVKTIACMKSDGYEFGSKLMKPYVLEYKVEKVPSQDYYIMPYREQEQINLTRDHMAARHPNEAPLNDSILELVDEIIAVHIEKQFGKAMQYDHANIKIEQWTYNSAEEAKAAFAELSRVAQYYIDDEECFFDFHQNKLYFFFVWESSKEEEMERVAQKILSKIRS